MTSPEIRQRTVEGVSLTIPRKPIYNHLGFVILPSATEVSKEEYCLVCGTRCEPNVHHGYWPRPARSELKKRQRATDRRLHGALDYTRDPYRALRIAAFSISDKICRKLHSAIHDLQEPPKEAPSKDMIELALSQHRRIEVAKSMAIGLKEKTHHTRNPNRQLEQHYLNAIAVLADLPKQDEIVFPTKTVDMETNLSEVGIVLVQRFDISTVTTGLELAIRGAHRKLSR